MTLMAKETIPCPACGLEQEIEVYQTINADITPELVDRLFDGKINVFNCTSCGHRARSAERMNKLELIQALKDATDLTKPEAAAVVDIFFNGMADALAKGDRVEIRGLCSFFVKEYDGYTGRNPKTGEKVKIKPKKLPFFKPGKELKERVDR
jgi:integration host factor subunit beta